MNKIQTLNTVKKQYLNQLLEFVEYASLQEINHLSNAIHQGASSQHCGHWKKEQNTFASCENENCQMLTECLELIATLPDPDGRPEFFNFNFDGNTVQEKEKQTKRQIRQQYCKNLSTSLSHNRHCQIEEALLSIPDNAWTTLEELSTQVKQKLSLRKPHPNN
ncbi:hypothetical protein [Photobacterium indicum]|uniref:hypothetical protein n=1 Tax=Photobacterium indicum TaxID=81447 RepID=UPI003D0DCC88